MHRVEVDFLHAPGDGARFAGAQYAAIHRTHGGHLRARSGEEELIAHVEFGPGDGTLDDFEYSR